MLDVRTIHPHGGRRPGTTRRLRNQRRLRRRLGTPVAGALFAIEALWVGRFSYGALFPSLVSAFVGHQVAANLGIVYLSPVFPSVPSLNVPFLLTIGLAGVTFGLAAFAFVEIMGLGKRVALLTKTSSMLTA